jgi:hypothetical protein
MLHISNNLILKNILIGALMFYFQINNIFNKIVYFMKFIYLFLINGSLYFFLFLIVYNKIKIYILL